MVSFNRYASGSVGGFLYRRVLGIEALDAGYSIFKFEPRLGGNITHAEGKTLTPYGDIEASWLIENDSIKMKVRVPVSTKCELYSPNEEKIFLNAGEHEYSYPLN